MTNFYTGVGSRQTPEHVLHQMRDLAAWLSRQCFVLRSGGANGADTAFAAGAQYTRIYLPWPKFNGVNSPLNKPSIEAYKLAAGVHPVWEKLSDGAKALHARNAHQVLGDNLDSPSLFLVCWTPDGCQCAAERTKDTGGTATAIVIAEKFRVPVFNFQKNNFTQRLRVFLGV